MKTHNSRKRSRSKSLRPRAQMIESLESRMLLAADLQLFGPTSNETVFHNAELPADVDMSGNVSPLDALLVINALNGGRTFEAARDTSPSTTRIDVSNDGRLTKRDVELVVESLELGRRFIEADSQYRLPINRKPADSDTLGRHDWTQVVTGSLDEFDPTVASGLRRAADLRQYSSEQLTSSRNWAFVPASEGSGTATSFASMLENGEQIGGLAIWTAKPSDQPFEALRQAQLEGTVVLYYPLVSKLESRKSIPNDPLFSNQWHLHNTGQTGGTPGVDANVVAAWDDLTGEGVVIGIVDDGLQYNHPDLDDRYLPQYSWDFNFNDSDPYPSANDDHGTPVAGVAAASWENTLGVAGTAPEAELAGLRLLSMPFSDADVADALSFMPDNIDIYNNSWGAHDDGTLGSAGPMTLQALADGVNMGRNGRGSIFTFAAGNGLQNNDNVNYDGYANSRYTIAVAAVDHNGVQSDYSEPGAPILVAAPSDGSGVGIVTTDLLGSDGLNNSSGFSDDYTDEFSGTSSATPVVSGVIALMLEANPNLTWRDVQHILVRSAAKNDAADPDWQTNGAGHLVNHKYGFGLIDAESAVGHAKGWTSVAPEESSSSGVVNVGTAIPDNDPHGVTSTTTIVDDINIESVEVIFDATHPYRGDLQIILTSPSGTQSILSEPHFDDGDDYNNWVFSSMRHWDESSLGDWTLHVQDAFDSDVGTFDAWQLILHGTPPINVEVFSPIVREGDPLLSIAQGETFDWGMNLNGNVDWNSMSVWVDMTKKFRRWGNVDAPWADGNFTLPFTNQGIPQEDFGGFWIHQGDPLGTYNFRYEGTGTVYFDGRASIVPGSVQTTGGVTTLQVELTSEGDSWMGFHGVSSADPIRNMRMVATDTDINSTEVFRDEFKRRLTPFSTLRFMDWSETNNSGAEFWGERRLPTETLQTPPAVGDEGKGGIAWEYMIQLANEMQKDAWINVPHLADDNYVHELAKLWRDNLDPDLKLYVEWSNETWNTIFSQAAGNGSDYSLPGNAGPETVRISNIFKQEFAGQLDRLHVTLGGHAANKSVIESGLQYFSDNGLSPSNIIESISIAPYFSPPTANDYGNLDDLFDDLFVQLGQVEQWIQDHAALSQLHGVELTAYESGQHLAAGFSGLSDGIAAAAQHDPRMADAYRQFNDIWFSLGGGVANHFSYVAYGGHSGHWYLLENQKLEGAIKWDAMMGLTMLPGDATIDHAVDYSDFSIIQANFGSTDAWWERGDFDGDRDVDEDDLQSFYKHAQLSQTEDAQVRSFADSNSIRLPHYVSLALNSVPDFPVTISLDGGTQLTTSPTEVTFPNSKQALQSIRVEVGAVHDFLAEGNHAGQITLTASSTDPNYDGVVISPVAVDILDNDPPDVIAPVATVNALPSTATSLSIPISVTATDPQNPTYPTAIVSGVTEIDVYVSRDGEPYSQWITLPASSPNAVFEAESNHTYDFYAIARDAANNEEPAPAVGAESEANILVPDLSPPTVAIEDFDFYGPQFTIPVSTTDVGESGVSRIDLYVSVDGGTQQLVSTATSGGAPSYSTSFNYTPLSDPAAHRYDFTAVAIDIAGNSASAIHQVYTARLNVQINGSDANEGSTLTATVSRNTPVADALEVLVRVDKHHDAFVPRYVTIPAGQSSVDFQINVLDDHRIDGDQLIGLAVLAEDYQESAASFTAIDTSVAALNIGGPLSRVAEGDSAFNIPQAQSYDYGVNPGGVVDWSPASAWIDLTKKFRRWGNANAPWEDGNFSQPFTEQGIPREDFGGVWIHLGDPTGIYNFRYEGSGTVNFDLNASVVPGSVQTQNGVTTLQVEIASNDVAMIQFTGVDANDPIRNMRMVAADTDINTTEVFRDEFKRRLAPFSTIRFMDWNLTNNSLATSWGERRLSTETLQTPFDDDASKAKGGVAWEFMIRLANETQKDAWINVPHLADDNYIRELAKLWRDNLDPSLKLYVEWSNETWNGLFTQSAGSGQDYYLPGNAGPETVRVSNIFHEVFADEPEERLHITLAGHTIVPYWKIGRGIEYMVDEGLNPTEIIDSVSVAPYMDWDSNAAISDLDDVFVNISQLTQGIRDHADIADTWGLELIAYESGQGLASDWMANLPEDLALDAQHDPRMADAYEEFNQVWHNEGGDLANHFGFIHTGGGSGHWNLLESAELTGSVKWDAMMRLTMKPGDATIDHSVTIDDFSVLQSNYGQTDKWWEEGDCDGDRDVDADDLRAFYKHASLTPAEDSIVRSFASSQSVSLPIYVDLALSSIPQNDVTLTIDGGSQLTTVPNQVVFSPDETALTPVRVEIVAVDDAISEGTHVGTLAYTITSDDPHYDQLAANTTPVDILDNEAPRVVSVLVGSTDWTETFRENALGETDGFYPIATDTTDSQLRNLPWKIDQVRIVFDQPMNDLAVDDLTITRASSSVAVSLNSFVIDENVATWGIESITADKLQLNLTDFVENDFGARLDGEHTTGDNLPSGDMMPGGLFRFRFDVLYGDADGSGRVDTADIGLLGPPNFLTVPGSTNYLIFADLDGSGRIDTGDLDPFRPIATGGNWLAVLPPGEPPSP